MTLVTTRLLVVPGSFPIEKHIGLAEYSENFESFKSNKDAKDFLKA